jgi:hypothetical protein
MTETDNTTIDAPRGWTHKSGYRLNSIGASIEYQADGRYRAIIEATVSETSEGLEYIVAVLERQYEGDHEEVYGPEMFHDKEQAKQRLEEEMQDLQTAMTAPVEYYPQAFNYGTRGGELSGVDHNGSRYCIPCAKDKLGMDEFRRHVTNPTEVRAGGPVFADSETDHRYYCDSCEREIEMQLIGEARRTPKQ